MKVNVNVTLHYFPHDGKMTVSVPDEIAYNPDKLKKYVDDIVSRMIEVTYVKVEPAWRKVEI